MTKSLSLLGAGIVLLVLAGAACTQTEQYTYTNSQEQTEKPAPAAETKSMTVLPPENLLEERTETNSDSKEGPTAIVKTTLGDIKIRLFETATPKTVENFLTLAEQGFYDGTVFHRVIPGFMIQGGDPLTREQRENTRIHGTGGPGYQFADEFNLHLNNRGTISMANAGPNTNGSQFFINVADNNFLDGRHAVFGEVIDGLEVVDKISLVKRDGADHPIDAIEILEIEMQK